MTFASVLCVTSGPTRLRSSIVVPIHGPLSSILVLKLKPQMRTLLGSFGLGHHSDALDDLPTQLRTVLQQHPHHSRSVRCRNEGFAIVGARFESIKLTFWPCLRFWCENSMNDLLRSGILDVAAEDVLQSLQRLLICVAPLLPRQKCKVGPEMKGWQRSVLDPLHIFFRVLSSLFWRLGC